MAIFGKRWLMGIQAWQSELPLVVLIIMVFGRRERRGACLPSKHFYKTKQILFQRILKWEKLGTSHQAERAETARGVGLSRMWAGARSICAQ